MLSHAQVRFFFDKGYVHIPEVFKSEEMDALERDLKYLIENWSTTDQGWTGPWRKTYMDQETEQKSKLTHLHDLQFYSERWLWAVTQSPLVEAVEDLLGENVELHHTTLHAKPPESGHPFPMHQDSAFYLHTDNRFIDALVHLDDTGHANGEIRFMEGSHKLNHLPHITESAEGPCTPHLPTNEFSLEDTVAVPAKRGDVVLFNIFTIHGSHINTTDRIRRMVRVGYRNPENVQISGQSVGRPGLMVKGRRPNPVHQTAFSTEMIR